jgi:arsenite/tail-anchored protein-transporting ATPase
VPPKRLDPRELLRTTRLVIVAGKGGVGKTTVTAVLARAAADSGLRVLAVDLDGKPTLAQLTRAGSSGDGHAAVDHLTLTASEALAEYLDAHGLRRVSKRLTSSGIIDVVSTAAPGIDDIVVLGKLKQLERAQDHDVVIVDGPAAGHAISFLMAPRGLLDTVRGGPIRTQALEVLEMLSDPARCQVVLVALPETTPVNELVETAYALEERVDVQLGPVVINGFDDGPQLPVDGSTDPQLAAAARFRNARRALHRREVDRLGEELAIDQVHLPHLVTPGLDADDIDTLVAAL